MDINTLNERMDQIDSKLNDIDTIMHPAILNIYLFKSR